MKWTVEAIKEEAKKYQHRTDFARSCNSAYYKAVKLGILEEVCSHMTPKSRVKKWSKEALINEALKYENITSFRKESRIAYETALRNGTISDIRNLISPGKKYKWTKAELKELAYKFNRRIDFRKAHGGAYKAIMDNKYYELLEHMPKQKRWSNDELHEEALKYSSRGEFLKKANSIYNVARARGLLDKICSHMQPSGHFYKRCIYLCEFEDGTVYIGLTFSVRDRTLRREKDPNDAVTKYQSKTNLSYETKQISDFLSLKEAVRLEEEIRQKYLNEGRKVLNRTKCGSVGATYSSQEKTKCLKPFDGKPIVKTPYNKKPVKITDMELGKIILADSIREASRITGIKSASICNECKGKSKTKGKFKFEYNCNAENYLV